ncbi:MAG TPA: hypothetical protein VG167_02450 [Verrucomicrobiae bacterium]|nr:hypothetical protein [Verrucomicrobiae bacterium]
MNKLGGIVRRLNQSAVVWSWAFNGLRLTSGIFVLPLLLRQLPKSEFSMYYVFLSVIGLIPIVDFGFSSAVGRFVSYAMAGATTLQAQGFVPSAAGTAGPNRPLLWRLLRTTRTLYRHLALIGLVVMGAWGTILVHSKVGETASPQFTWLAWALTLAAATFDLYSTWWNTFLQCMNYVLQSTRVGVVGYAMRIGLTCLLLARGWGLMSVPIGNFAGCLLNRTFSRLYCLRALGPRPAVKDDFSEGSLLHLLWPNSWRVGLQLLSTYLRTNANTAICVAFFWNATSEYGLSVQVMNIALGMAAVWTYVKWPAIGQLRSSQNLAGLRQMLWPRVWLQIFSFLILAAGAIVLGPPLLKLLGTDKHMLPGWWLLWLAVGALFDMTFIFWGTLLSYENRIPTLWPTVATNVASLGLALGLSRGTHLGVAALVLAPLISGLVFNSWYWALAGARSLGTTWLRFMFWPPENVSRQFHLPPKPELPKMKAL